MLANRLRVLGLTILVALAVSSTPMYYHAQANNSGTVIKEAELLKKYVVLSAQNTPAKNQLMRTFSPAEQSYLWRLHLALYLASHSSLSRDQQNIVIETLSLITPQLFSPPDSTDPNAGAVTLERVDQLRRRGLQVFTKQEAAEIFSVIGGAQDGAALRKYSQLSELSKADRKVSFNVMSAEDQSSLWRVHFALNLARHPEWTQQQRSVVFEAIAIATPELYRVPKDSTWARLVDEPIRLLTQKALLAFSKQEGAALFSDLGLNEQPKSNHARRRTTGSCECSMECDWCTHQCLSSDCTVYYRGCGTMFLYACNGTCYVPPNSN
jgi:hypothetical protein